MTLESLKYAVRGIPAMLRAAPFRWNSTLFKQRLSYFLHRKFEPFTTPCGYRIESAQQLLSWWEIDFAGYLFRRWPKLMPMRPTIVDIGANHGIFAWCVRKRFPNARIIGFEPIPECYEYCKNLGVYNEVHSCALSDVPGQVRLSISRQTGLTSTIAPLFTPEDEALTVEAKLLDSFGIKPDFIKLDVDGGEEKVIKGGQQTFRQSKACIVECIGKEQLSTAKRLLNRSPIKKLSAADYVFA
jgi:FkbM family methyltransferase